MAAEPLYRQIAEDLRIKIESGELAQGRQLPTEIELMEQYNASRNTIRDAIKLLTARTLVETRPGQGTFVVQKINPFVTTLTGPPDAGDTVTYIEDVSAGGRQAASSEPRVEVQRARRVVAEALRIEKGSPVVSRHVRRFIDGIPWSLQTSFYPMSLVERGAVRLLQAENIEEGAVAYLADTLGLKQVGYRDSIAVRAPDATESSFFRLPADGRIPVFEVFRTGYYQAGERLRLTITVCPADRNRFLVRVGDVPPRGARAAQTA
jgi:GntR family transcriptional regulator